MKTALVTGITGQDGSYLSELLLEKEYIVWGIIRRSSNINTQRIDHLYDNENLILRYGDLSDGMCLLNILYDIKTTHPNMDRLENDYLVLPLHSKVSVEDVEKICHTIKSGW